MVVAVRLVVFIFLLPSNGHDWYLNGVIDIIVALKISHLLYFRKVAITFVIKISSLFLDEAGLTPQEEELRRDLPVVDERV